LDSSTFHVDGDYNHRENAEDLAESVIHITRLYVQIMGGVNQRWLVVYTRAAHERAEKTVNRQ
jgi:hypothetical protein